MRTLLIIIVAFIILGLTVFTCSRQAEPHSSEFRSEVRQELKGTLKNKLESFQEKLTKEICPERIGAELNVYSTNYHEVLGDEDFVLGISWICCPWRGVVHVLRRCTLAQQRTDSHLQPVSHGPRIRQTT